MSKLAREASGEFEFRDEILRRFAGSPASLAEWARSVYHYREEVEEVVRTPERMLHDFERQGYIEGDCDDISTFLAAAYKVLQFRVRFVVLRVTDPSEFEHVFVEYWSPQRNQWQRVDLTVPAYTQHKWQERFEVEV
jgi:hypothetical protein